MKTFHLRGRSPLAKIERGIRGLKIILFDLTLLIIFVVTLIRVLRSDLGW